MYAILGLFRLVIYFVRSARAGLNALRSEKWATAEAIVTEDPAGYAGSTVEVPYTYRFEGELYTGLHQEPSFGGVSAKFRRRFVKGSHFLVRVKPSEPEVSIMRNRDQADDIEEFAEQIDEL
ncbi:MAG TPA: hypothetical protein VMU05_13265 [Dongiaceae bacterium]|nr:hypothetical protein [Dongiaceae bacterium]